MHGFTLSSDERVVRVLRRSKWVLLKPFSLSLIAIFVPWWYIVSFDLHDLKTWVSVWTAILALYLLREYKLWTFQKYIITTKRLIKVHHDALFKKVVVETPLERILNVSFKTTGLFSVIGRFGDVEVQVVGLMEPIVLKNITRPAKIKEYLWRAHEQAVNAKGFDPTHLQEHIGYTKPNQKIL